MQASKTTPPARARGHSETVHKISLWHGVFIERADAVATSSREIMRLPDVGSLSRHKISTQDRTSLSRRSALLAALAVASPAQRAVAEYGSGANVAAPAFLPSPFVPTGELGKTCAVVALGREDVCLEYKKVLTAYDLLQLGKAKDKLDDLESSTMDSAAASLKELRDNLSAFLPSVEANDFNKVCESPCWPLRALIKMITCEHESTHTITQLEKAVPAIVAAAASDKKLKADAAALENRCKEREASPVARATIKLVDDFVKLVDGS